MSNAVRVRVRVRVDFLSLSLGVGGIRVCMFWRGVYRLTIASRTASLMSYLKFSFFMCFDAYDILAKEYLYRTSPTCPPSSSCRSRSLPTLANPIIPASYPANTLPSLQRRLKNPRRLIPRDALILHRQRDSAP